MNLLLTTLSVLLLGVATVTTANKEQINNIITKNATLANEIEQLEQRVEELEYQRNLAVFKLQENTVIRK